MPMFMLSNWTAHFNRCKNQRRGNQHGSLLKFFGSNVSKSSKKGALPFECEKSIPTTLKDNQPDTSTSIVTHCDVADKICEQNGGIRSSEVSSANDCEVISITKNDAEKDSEIINPDERVDSQEDSLLQLNTDDSKKLTNKVNQKL